MLAPTTSGSGAETTHFAVVYIGDEKYSVAGPVLRPDVVILDPALTLSGSAYQRATSGIDAVTQAIESLWAVGRDPRQPPLGPARAGLPAAGDRAFRHHRTTSRRRAPCRSGATWPAGRSTSPRPPSPHALSYGITKRYGVSHGHAVALTLGVFLEAHADAPAERLRPGWTRPSHAAAMAEVLTALQAADGAAARARFTTLLQRIGLETNLARSAPRLDRTARLWRSR